MHVYVLWFEKENKHTHLVSGNVFVSVVAEVGKTHTPLLLEALCGQTAAVRLDARGGKC